MKTKNLFIFSILSWLGIGVFYVMYLLKFEPTLVGVFRELLLLPLFGCGVVFPILFLIQIVRKKK